MRKKVLITGGSSGLGRAITNTFASHGYDVVLTYSTSQEETKEFAAHLFTEYGVEVDTLQLDLSDEEACRNLPKDLDRLDVLVNNAATNEDKNFEEFTSKDFLDTYRVNVIGPYLLSIAFRDILKKSHGSIVNVASTNGIDTMYKESATYDASKAALINLTQNMSNAFAPDIRVNAVAPGWINTDSTRDMDPKFKTAAENSNLLHRFADPQEIASLVYFVASEEASYLTGSVIRIDGGNKYGNR